MAEIEGLKVQMAVGQENLQVVVETAAKLLGDAGSLPLCFSYIFPFSLLSFLSLRTAPFYQKSHEMKLTQTVLVPLTQYDDIHRQVRKVHRMI